MNARFYAPDAHAPGALVMLPVDEAQHLTRVLRLRAGDHVRAFNGVGAEFDAVVETAARDEVVLRIGESRTAAPEPGVTLTLAQAVLKGDKMDDVVRDAVMMGVAAVQPVVSERAETSIAALDRGRRRARWERIAVSSTKQCGRAVVPQILEPRAFDDVPAALASLRLPIPGLMLVEPGASRDAVPLRELELKAPAQATVLVGPEGGWTPSEIEVASSSCRLITLGGRTLRADAMALVALAALFAQWNEL